MCRISGPSGTNMAERPFLVNLTDRGSMEPSRLLLSSYARSMTRCFRRCLHIADVCKSSDGEAKFESGGFNLTLLGQHRHSGTIFQGGIISVVR
jgi:hypothetical protein